MDRDTLINKLNVNAGSFWTDFKNLPNDFALEFAYLQAIYITQLSVPVDCQAKYFEICNKIDALISWKDLGINEREDLVIKALQGIRDPYKFLNVKSYNHYLFVSNFGDLPKELSYFVNRVSIDVLKYMNSKHYQEFMQILKNMGFNYVDATKLSMQIYHVLGYFKGRDLLNGKYGAVSKGKLKSIFGNIELMDIVYDVDKKIPDLNSTIINLMLGASYHIDNTPIKKYLTNEDNEDIIYFMENLNLILTNWNLILDEYTRRTNLERLKLRLNVGQIHSILDNIIVTKREVKRKESFRARKKTRYNKIPGFELRDMPLLNSDLFDYIGTVNKYVTSPSNVSARALELSRMMEDNSDKKFPNVKLQDARCKLFVFHPQDRDLISAGFRISSCFVPTGEADSCGVNPSFVEYCLTSPYGGWIEIRDSVGHSIMFSPILRNGNTLLIHSVQVANYTREEIRLIADMLKKWATEVIESSKLVEGDNGIIAVTITNRGNLPEELFPTILPEEKNFHMYDVDGKYAGIYDDLKHPNHVVSMKDGYTIYDIKYDFEVPYDYVYPLSDLEINHQVVSVSDDELSLIKEMEELGNVINEYSNMRRTMLKGQPVLAMEMLRQIKKLKNDFNEKYRQLFAISTDIRVDQYKEYNNAVDTIKEICKETNTAIDFDLLMLTKIYYTDNWFIALDVTGELHYECISGAEYQFLLVLEDVKKQYLGSGR